MSVLACEKCSHPHVRLVGQAKMPPSSAEKKEQKSPVKLVAFGIIEQFLYSQSSYSDEI